MSPQGSVIKISVEIFPGGHFEDAVAQLVQLAGRMGVWCEAKIDGIIVLASPTDTPDTLARNYEVARERKASFVSARLIRTAE